MLERLAERYNESPVSLGLQSNGMLLEIYSTSDGKTWTAVTTRPDGISCLVAAGRSWQRLRPVNPVGDPA